MDADFGKMNQKVYSELKEQVSELAKFGIQWEEYASNPETLQHVRERHFTGNVPGSKFSPTLSDDQIGYIVHSGELSVVSGLVNQLRSGATTEAGLREEHTRDFASTVGAVGTNVLIERENNKGGIIAHRNPDNPRDVPVYLKLAGKDDLPKTSGVTFIGGTYRPEEGKPLTAGFYTFFPDDVPVPGVPNKPAPPMNLDDPMCKAFWDKHGFLATKEEMEALAAKLANNPEEAQVVQNALIEQPRLSNGRHHYKALRDPTTTRAAAQSKENDVKEEKASVKSTADNKRQASHRSTALSFAP